MAKATADKATTGAPEGFKRVGGTLPPFIVLNVGESLRGTVTNVRKTTKEKGKGKKKQVVTEYKAEVELSETVAAHEGTKENMTDRVFQKGEKVTLPSAGILIHHLRTVAFDLAGITDEAAREEFVEKEEIPFDRLVGVEVIIKRLDDRKIKKGEWAGNTSKNYSLDYRA